MAIALVVIAFLLPRADAAPARIVDLNVDPDSLNLVLDVSGGAFDPVLWVEGVDKDHFRIVIEGENAEFAESFQRETLALNRRLSAAIHEIDSINLMQQKDGQNTIRIVLAASKSLRPQIRSHTGRQVTIALIGATRGTPAKAGVAESKPSEEPLSVVTLAKEPQKQFHAPDSGFSIYSLSKDTGMFPVVVRQAWNDYRDGRLDSARMALETHLGNRPHDVVGPYLLGLVHLADDEKQRAALALQKVTEETPRFLPAWLELIKLNLSEGHFSETDEFLRQALREFPEQPDLLYTQGLLQEARGQTDSALETYLQVLTLEPAHALAHYRLAIVELKRNRPAAATVELRRLILANPDDLAALKALGYAYHRGQETDKASEAYLRALKPDVLINYAGLLNERHQTQDALTLYRAAELLAGRDANIAYNLGMIYAELDEPQRAIASLNRFIDLARDEKDAASRERIERAKAKIKTLAGEPKASPGEQSSLLNSGKMDYRFAVSAGH